MHARRRSFGSRDRGPVSDGASPEVELCVENSTTRKASVHQFADLGRSLRERDGAQPRGLRLIHDQDQHGQSVRNGGRNHGLVGRQNQP